MSDELIQDEWGYDPEYVRRWQPLLDRIYDRWWRITALGLDNIPSSGRALIVANHGGLLPWDAAMIATALRKHSGSPRDPRFLVADWAFDVPFASSAMRRFGGVPASPHNALRLLDTDHLVTVFPEGTKGTGKPYSQRYRLERFGRGGFVELALRADAPIIPCAVVGSDDIYPMLAEWRSLARLARVPFMPVTPTFPWLGPLGLVPLPARWRIEFCPPIDLSVHGPDAAGDRARALEISEQIRDLIQAKVLENLVAREGAWR